MKAFYLILILVLVTYLSVLGSVYARTTPQDITDAKKDSYNKIVQSYSQSNKDKLTKISEEIGQINKRRTDQLESIMVTQAGILDEYERRTKGKNKDGMSSARADALTKARYWITYAHEAVAYQAAKVYVFDLSNEKNIGSDIQNTVNLFKSDLNSTRDKVINSQNILKELIK